MYGNLFEDFSFFYDLPPDSVVGGVGLYIRTCLNPIIRCDLKDKHGTNLRVENIWTEITCPSNNKYIIDGIYRHPGQSILAFNEALSDIFDLISNKRCIIAGDVNIDLLKLDKHKPTTEYVNTLLLYNMLLTVLLPTRVKSRSSTLIDHIYTNCHDKLALKAGNLVTDFSDHISNFLL